MESLIWSIVSTVFQLSVLAFFWYMGHVAGYHRGMMHYNTRIMDIISTSPKYKGEYDGRSMILWLSKVLEHWDEGTRGQFFEARWWFSWPRMSPFFCKCENKEGVPINPDHEGLLNKRLKKVGVKGFKL